MRNSISSIGSAKSIARSLASNAEKRRLSKTSIISKVSTKASDEGVANSGGQLSSRTVVLSRDNSDVAVLAQKDPVVANGDVPGKKKKKTKGQRSQSVDAGKPKPKNVGTGLATRTKRMLSRSLPSLNKTAPVVLLSPHHRPLGYGFGCHGRIERAWWKDSHLAAWYKKIESPPPQNFLAPYHGQTLPGSMDASPSHSPRVQKQPPSATQNGAVQRNISANTTLSRLKSPPSEMFKYDPEERKRELQELRSAEINKQLQRRENIRSYHHDQALKALGSRDHNSHELEDQRPIEIPPISYPLNWHV